MDARFPGSSRSEEHTSELQSRLHLVCRLLLEKKKKQLTILQRSCKTVSSYFYCNTYWLFLINIVYSSFLFFFFNVTAITEIYTLSLHDALPISRFPGSS